MNKGIVACFAASMAFLLTFPVYADSIVHLYSCKLHDGKTRADVERVSADWLKAAKSMEGGTDIEVSHEFPLAADPGERGFTWVAVYPDAKTWGLFNNNYADSPAARADDAWEKVAICSGSSLWESVDIK